MLNSHAEAQKQSVGAMHKEAKKNPELYVLFGVMAGVFGVAGYYFTANPTSSGNEKSVPSIPGSEPWNTGKDAKYQYHPYGDTSKEPKDAPSPLRTSIIPNVNLPKDLHDQFNKYGKDDYS
ncbi:hypothetical protein BT63DRAFT_420140 [Microthyrium microscopicum]|uniref:Uncharacterized protein n=1 Tax=Microthyrium microscopicum TaxID=703497 RepID=A0A6A6USW4_9PEZI|nr:hypothetical protein BT63DRAFT_420140 [Microthyrium microscopicum]